MAFAIAGVAVNAVATDTDLLLVLLLPSLWLLWLLVLMLMVLTPATADVPLLMHHC